MRSPTKFNSNNIPKRMVMEALIPQYVWKTSDIIQALAVPMNLAVSAFFEDLASYMGTVEGLPADTPGFTPWKPLDLSYERRKQTAAFWIYTASPGVDSKTRARNALAYAKMRKASARKIGAARTKLLEGTFGDSLISAVSRIDGYDALGGVEITAKAEDPALQVVWRGLMVQGHMPPDEITSNKREADGSAGAEIATYTRRTATSSLPPEIENIKSYKINVTFRLWDKINSKQLNTVESFLVTNGFLDQKQAAKLIGKTDYHRPLIKPFMAYYGQIKLPAILRDATRSLTAGMGSAAFSNKAGAFSPIVTLNASKFIGAL